MKVKDILERVTTLYNDSDYVRITKQEYLKFLDDAINQLILSRPDANVKTSVVKLKPGTRQEIPQDGYSLIQIYANVNTPDGVTILGYGNPIFQVERKDLDYFNNWHVPVGGTTEVTEFAYDTRSPRTFWVNPPVTATPDIYVEMDYSHGVVEYAKMPDSFEVVLEMDIPVSDIFKGPLISYMLYLLYSTDSTSQIDRQVAQRYVASFYQALGLEYKSMLYVIPRIEAVPPTAAPAPTGAV